MTISSRLSWISLCGCIATPALVWLAIQSHLLHVYSPSEFAAFCPVYAQAAFVACGIISLFILPREGRNGILIRSIISIVLGAVSGYFLGFLALILTATGC